MISRIIEVKLSVNQPKLKVEAQIALTNTTIISHITKTKPNICFIILCFKENNNKHIVVSNTVYYFTVRELDIALGNHALSVQATDYSLIC